MHHMIRGNLLFSSARIDMGPPVLLLLLYMQIGQDRLGISCMFKIFQELFVKKIFYHA